MPKRNTRYFHIISDMKIIKSQISSSNNDNFTNNIEVSVFSAGDNYFEDSTATITYSIDIEYRSYGIQGISVIPLSISPISILDEDGNVLKEIQLDISQVKIDINKGNGVYITNLNLFLDLNLNPDYGRSYLDVVSL